MFQLDLVPSDCGTMRGTNGVGPAVDFLYHFLIYTRFAAMTGCWFGACITSNFDWVVLCTPRLVVVCFAIMPFLKDVFFHDANVNHGRCQEMISGRQYGFREKIVLGLKKLVLGKRSYSATATNLIITTPRTSCIYFLPKIHKPNNLGRPIVSACSCPTELISSYLDKIMAPIVRSLPSYVKDSQHELQIFRDFNFLGEDKLIFTMDITSLYTVIPNGEGLLALKHFFDLRTVKEPSSETLLRLAELVLTLNCFSFADSYSKQINGVALGTKMGPSYANLFVGYIEHKFSINTMALNLNSIVATLTTVSAPLLLPEMNSTNL